MPAIKPFFKLALSQGKVALVDEDDRWKVEAFPSWHAHQAEAGRWYARTTLPGCKGRKERLHRILMGCAPGDGKIVDHENGDSLDCRRFNLRLTTPTGNAQNVRAHRDARSRHVGVSFETRRGQWVASLWRNGRFVMTPTPFSSEQAAARARVFVELLWGSQCLQ